MLARKVFNFIFSLFLLFLSLSFLFFPSPSLKVIEPVLIIAAGLSVQSPFTQTAFNQEEASSQTARSSLESDHGDPYTLLNAFDEWIEVSTLIIE